MFAVGATGGHVYPAIALAQDMLETSVLFLVSTTKQDKAILSRYPYLTRSIVSSARNPFIIMVALFQSLLVVLLFRPAVVLSTGGYLTFPVNIAAALLRIPVVLLEQNVIPGRVNRWSLKLARWMCISFPETCSYFNQKDQKKLIVTGNPIRKTYFPDANTALMDLACQLSCPSLLVLGGSQGARSLNMFIKMFYPFFLTGTWSLIHLCGHLDLHGTGQESGFHIGNKEGEPRVLVMPYSESMDRLYNKADLVLSRAGATTIAELMAFQKPAILVPYPHASDNHQYLNANAFVSQYPNQASIMLESDLDFQHVQDRMASIDLAEPRAQPTFLANEKVTKLVNSLVSSL